MKKSIIILIFCTLNILGFSQKYKVILSVEKFNFLYRGVENQVSAMIENTKSENVILLSNEATIKKYENYKFGVFTKNTEEVQIKVYKKNKKDSVYCGTFTYLAIELKPTIAIVSIDSNNQQTYFNNGGFIEKNDLINFKNFRIYFHNFLLDNPIYLINYRVLIFRNDSLLFQNSFQTTFEFEAEAIEHFKNLKKGDIVLIDKIFVGLPTDEVVLNPIEFIIK